MATLWQRMLGWLGADEGTARAAPPAEPTSAPPAAPSPPPPPSAPPAAAPLSASLSPGAQRRHRKLAARQAAAQRALARGDQVINGGPVPTLPDPLVVAGDLRISGTRLEALPTVVTVGGDLHVTGRSRLRQGPQVARVGRDLRLEGVPVAALTGDLQVGRDLRLLRCRSLEVLPEGLVVPRNLDLRGCTSLQRLPDGLRVGGDLRLSGCVALTSLPRGLVVGGQLDLSGCVALKAIEHPIEVGGYIEVGGAGLCQIPPQMAACRWAFRRMITTSDLLFPTGVVDPLRLLGVRNTELRRLLLDRVGVDAVLEHLQVEVVDADEDPGGPRRLLRVPALGGHQLLDCRCPSTGRRYLLGVPTQRVSTAHAAAAWLAGMSEADYCPVLET